MATLIVGFADTPLIYHAIVAVTATRLRRARAAGVEHATGRAR